MTVEELRAALASAPDQAEVVTEGCDCTSGIEQVVLIPRRRGRPHGTVYLRRPARFWAQYFRWRGRGQARQLIREHPPSSLEREMPLFIGTRLANDGWPQE